MSAEVTSGSCEPSRADERREVEIPDGFQRCMTTRRYISRSPVNQPNVQITDMTNFKTPIVLDTGSGLMKAGFADQDLPNTIFPNIIGLPKYEEIMNGNFEWETFIGHEAQHMRRSPGIEIWHHTFQLLQVDPDDHPVLLTEAAMNPLANRQRMVELMFECLNVPLTYVAMQARLALYATGGSTGVVFDSGDGVSHSVPVFDSGDGVSHSVPVFDSGDGVSHSVPVFDSGDGVSHSVPVFDSGDGVCHSVPVFDSGDGVSHSVPVFDSGDGVCHSVPVFEGYCLPQAVQHFTLAGHDVTMHLKMLLQEQGVCMHTSAEMEIVREIKEKCCRVAQDYESELTCGRSASREMYYTMPDGQVVCLSTEWFRAPEILFKPELIGRDHYGMHESIFKSILRSDIDLWLSFLGNIVLSDFRECVTSPKDRDFSVWSGGAVLANLSSFASAWISHEEYGHQIVFRKCF
ncbi:unnamed protein product [Coregonus sp. 'balchen']|nr:unnamed protein product [Coregonus sp. 'balchen']